MKFITLAAAMMLATVSQAHGQAAYAPSRANVPFLPPLAFDHPYSGKQQVIRAGAELMAHLCPRPDPGKRMTGCAVRVASGAECLIVIANDEILRSVGIYDAKVILRHEIGHCNGWPGDHPGARALAEF
jgi:hypothetical protein